MEQATFNKNTYTKPKGRVMSQKQAWFAEIDQYLGKGQIKPVIFWYWANRNGKECVDAIIAELKDKESNPNARPIRKSRVACFIDECKRRKTELKEVENKPTEQTQ